MRRWGTCSNRRRNKLDGRSSTSSSHGPNREKSTSPLAARNSSRTRHTTTRKAKKRARAPDSHKGPTGPKAKETKKADRERNKDDNRSSTTLQGTTRRGTRTNGIATGDQGPKPTGARTSTVELPPLSPRLKHRGTRGTHRHSGLHVAGRVHDTKSGTRAMLRRRCWHPTTT